MQLDCASATVAELLSNPGDILFSHPLVSDWLTSRRWFMDKDADIIEIASQDSFIVGMDAGVCICGLMAQFRLRQKSATEYRKCYFIPLLLCPEPPHDIVAEDTLELLAADGRLYVGLAEHSHLFQRFFIRELQTGNSIATRKGNTVCFKSYGSQIKSVDPSGLITQPLRVSTSNVLTLVSTHHGWLVAKSYKDMRGNAGALGKRWPPNMEMARYEALAAAGYTNLPQLHGVATYRENATGESVPLMILMDKIDCVDEVGRLFCTALSRLVDGDSRTRALLMKVSHELSRLLAVTVADFHHAFLRSGKVGFEAVDASPEDLVRWSDAALNRYEQALVALKHRSGQRSEEVMLGELVSRLQALAPFELPRCLLSIPGRLKKAQVHGDLSTAQGLIDSPLHGNTVASLFEQVALGNAEGAFLTAAALVRRVRWMDFEGEPAKEMVDQNYDTRQSLLVDVAGALQGFWYLANTGLYTLLGLCPCDNPAHKESARKVSLALAGLMTVQEAGIGGATQKVVALFQDWLTTVSDGFVQGYLDRVEENHMEAAILTAWDRHLAKAVVDYWVVFRALHELRYETYGRDFGWEGIPAGRILQLTPRVVFTSHAKS